MFPEIAIQPKRRHLLKKTGIFDSVFHQAATSRLWLITILAGHFLLVLAYSLATPLGEAPDEADHWAYVVHLARERSLPVGPDMTQGKHPPLFYITSAWVASLAEPSNDFLRSNPDVQVQPQREGSPNFFIHTRIEDWPWQEGVLAFRLVRLWSALLSTCTVAALYGLVRAALLWRALPPIPYLAHGCAAVLAFLPGFAFISGTVNNDNAAALFGTLTLWGAFAHLKSGGCYRPGWWTPLALGCGLLSKSSSLALWPAVGIAILFGCVIALPSDRTPGRWGRTLLHQVIRVGLPTTLLVFLPALLIASPWLLRNWQLYGDPLGMALVRQTIDLRTSAWTASDSLWLLRGWFFSFWGKFGGAGHIPMAMGIYLLLGLLSGVSLLGMLARLFKQTTQHLRFGLILLPVTLAAVVLAVWQYSLIALGTDQGRLLYPGIAAIVILWVVGLLDWVPRPYARHAVLLLSVGMLALGLYGVFGVIRPSFAPPSDGEAAKWEDVVDDSIPTWQALSLVAWEFEQEPVLYWRANTSPTQDYRVILRLVAMDGSLVWEWHRSPAAGRWSTDHWPAGVVMKDRYQIVWPEWAESGRYHLEVGLQPFGGEVILPVRGGVMAASPDVPFFYLGEVTKAE